MSDLQALSIQELEEHVIFSEWRQLRHSSSRSLERTHQLMQALNYDATAADHAIIGVVGSKGKGTAAAYASAALAGAGWRTGTVMSPGVVSNADRVRIDGQPVGEYLRRRTLLRIEKARQKLPVATEDSGYLAPTGLFLLLGMLIFAELGVDVAVAEAGIGGAADDLSHWPLEVVIVTGIFGEHLDILGPTVADVARNKTAVITAETTSCVSFPQDAAVQEILAQRCMQTSTVLQRSQPQDHQLVSHLPEGYGTLNASLGVAAARLLHGQALPSGSAAAVRSVRYPGRLSVHRWGPHRCVVDSAVSREGLAAATKYAGQVLAPAPGGSTPQLLTCLPPSKDLQGFIAELGSFPGRKVFVEIPGAYTGMPPRGVWPWEWVQDTDLRELLGEADSLAVGTVLFTSLVLRTLKVDADRLFTP